MNRGSWLHRYWSSLTETRLDARPERHWRGQPFRYRFLASFLVLPQPRRQARQVYMPPAVLQSQYTTTSGDRTERPPRLTMALATVATVMAVGGAVIIAVTGNEAGQIGAESIGGAGITSQPPTAMPNPVTIPGDSGPASVSPSTGSGPTESYTPTAAPDPVTGLRAVIPAWVGEVTINLSWNRVPNALTYDVHYVTDRDATDHTVNVRGLTYSFKAPAGSIMCVQVRANNEYGSSDWSPDPELCFDSTGYVISGSQ